ncbi:MAG: phage integrase SAM-like domain-containing protein, partial [Betaproteobacteria bacterium]
MARKSVPKTAAQRDKHKTVPIPSSITAVPGYPNKLVIYKSEASPYWWARYYAGKTVRRSTKTENKTEAFAFAKKLYDEINHRIHTGLSVGRADKFAECVEAIYADQKAQVKRGALNPVTAKLSEYRFEKHILPHFKHAELSQINYFALQGFLNYLSGLPEKLSVNTIRIYMHLVRKVLTYAHRAEYIKAMPPFPVVGVVDNPRDYFTVQQYKKLRKKARELRGKVYEIRKIVHTGTDEELTLYVPEHTFSAGRVIHRVKFEHELYEMIVFMTNSFIRPSDIKTMQHKHVEKDTREGHTYLRLRLPATKGHETPVVTLERAVKVYERLTRHYKREEIKLQKQLALQAKEFEEKERKRQERTAKKLLKNPIQTVRLTQREQKAIKKAKNAAKKAKQQLPTLASPDNYVFMPQYHSNRDHALKLIQ